MKIAVIANCHTQAISNYLRIITGCRDILNVPVHMFGSELYERQVKNLDSLIEDKSAIIFTFNLSDRFGEIKTSKLKARARARVYTITNLYFSGFHPDITYLGSMGKRIHSPMGDLHSKTILTAFNEGLDVDGARESFNSTNYERLGFFEEYHRSETELLKRDKLSDITFANEFLEIIKSKHALYTMNHPIPEVLYNFTCKLCEQAGIEYSEYPIEFFNNYLSNAAWWPIYQEIADFHGAKFKSPMFFKQPDNRGGNALGLTEFITRCYQTYEEVGADTIKAAFSS